MMTPSAQYQEEKTYAFASSAYYAYLFVPDDKKQAIQLLYAFFREINDILYVTTEVSVARIKLAWWKEEVHRLFEGKSEHPISQALQKVLPNYPLNPQYFLYMIESIEMDLSHHRYLDWQSLKNFCTLQSGALACLVTQVLSQTNEKTLRFAQHLAVAIHYTDCLRHLGKDAAQGRLYLPLDFLREYDIKAADILNGKYSEAFEQFMRAQGKFARQLFQEAFSYFPKEERNALRPCLIRAKLSLNLLDRLEKEKWKVLDQDVHLSPLSKLLTASKVWITRGRLVV